MAISVCSNSTDHAQLCLWLARLGRYPVLHRAGDGGTFVLFVATAVATRALDGPVHCLTPRGQAAAARLRASTTTTPTPTASTTTATIVVRRVVSLLLLGSALEDSIGAGGEGLALAVS
jgi:hypothetical protein